MQNETPFSFQNAIDNSPAFMKERSTCNKKLHEC